MAGKKGAKWKPLMLRDAEYVLQTDEEDKAEPDTPQQRVLRGEKESSPTKFMDRVMALQRSFQAAKGVSVGEAVGKDQSEADAGTERCVELVNGLLEDKGWAQAT